MQILKEKHGNINKNHKIANKKIKKDIEKKNIENEHKIKEMKKKEKLIVPYIKIIFKI